MKSLIDSIKKTFSDKRLWLCIPLGMAFALCFNQLISLLGLLDIFPAYKQNVRNQMFAVPLMTGIILYGLITPIFEEVLFRWILFGRLKLYMATAAAALGSSFIFGVYHGNIIQFIYAFIFGIILCFAYSRFNSVIASIIVHGAANVFVYVTASVGWFSFLGSVHAKIVSVIVGGALGFVILRMLYLSMPKDRDNYKKWIFPQ